MIKDFQNNLNNIIKHFYQMFEIFLFARSLHFPESAASITYRATGTTTLNTNKLINYLKINIRKQKSFSPSPVHCTINFKNQMKKNCCRKISLLFTKISNFNVFILNNFNNIFLVAWFDKIPISCLSLFVFKKIMGWRK